MGLNAEGRGGGGGGAGLNTGIKFLFTNRWPITEGAYKRGGGGGFSKQDQINQSRNKINK